MGENDTTVDSCFSIPIIITTQVQCSFGTYFFEMYQYEFGWSEAEYGKIPSLYNLVQLVSYILLGVIFNEGINKKLGGSASLKDHQKVEKRLNASKWIEVGAVFFHWLTYFLLIYFPIKWHGVKTPYVDSLFDKTSEMGHALYYGPVNISDLMANVGLGRRTRDVITATYFPFRMCWFILYPFMKAFYVIVVNFGAIFWILSWPFKLCRKPKTVDEILPVLETLRDPACSACCNTTCCNNFAMRMKHFGRWMGTRTFFIYLLTFAHGVGVSTFELSDKAIPTYIYTGAAELGTIVTANTAFFTVSNVVIIFIFSMVKYYSHSKVPFTEAFYLLAIIFLILQLPIMPPFFVKTERQNAVTATGIGDPGSSWICLAIKALCLTVFHGTVFFWIFTGGPMTTYVAKNILDNHRGIWSFGVLTILAGFGPANWFFFAGTAIAKKQMDFNAFKDIAKMTVMGVSIAGQIFTYLVFFPHDWSWNTNYWINWLLIALTGAVNTYLVTYIYISIDHVVDDTRVRDYKWIINGCFFGFSHAVDSWGIDKVWKFYARRDTKHISWGCIQFDFDCSFHSVYKKMTILFWIINLIFFGVYCVVHFLDELNASAAKLVAAGKDLKNTAAAFQTAADSSDNAAKLRTFLAASAALNEAGKALKDFAEKIEKSGVFESVKTQLQAAANGGGSNNFRDACGTSQDDGFYSVANELSIKSLKKQKSGSAFEAINQFGTAKTKFGRADDQTESAAKKFKDFAASSSTDTDFTSAVSNFADAASYFNTAAKLIDPSASDLSSAFTAIKDTFKAAASRFEGAATGLYEAIKNVLPYKFLSLPH